MKNFITVIILMLCLCGCSVQVPGTTAEPHTNEPTDSQTILSSVAPTSEPTSAPYVKTPEFMFTTPIADGLPEFTFEIFEKELHNDEFAAYEYDVRVSCDEFSEYETQTIKIKSSVKWTEDNKKGCIDLVDIDFDGFADIQALTSSGMVNVNYMYYRWNMFSGQGEFENTPFFELLTTGYALYPDTKQIISSSRDSAINHPREMYQLSDTQNGGWLGTFQRIRREEQELTPDGEIAVRIYFGDEEIYTETVPAESDGVTVSGNLDNYLRFGVGDPIDIEAATQLLYGEYGDKDSSTGFPFSFTFEEMAVIEKLSCYKFRMQWFADNNHWSTIDFAGVTPDGRIIDNITVQTDIDA